MTKLKKQNPPQNTENIHQVKIDKLIFGGKALGSFANGCRVLVPKLLPTEEATVYIHKLHRHYAEALVLDITKKSVQRIVPQCPYFETCGGCSLSNLDYEQHLYWKSEFLRESLVGIAHFTAEDLEFVAPIIPAQDHFNYRNKTEFSFNNVAQEVVVGYHKLGRKFDLIETDSCLLQTAVADQTISIIRDLVRQGEKKAFARVKNDDGEYVFMGFYKSLILRTNGQGEILVALRTVDQDFTQQELQSFLTALQTGLGQKLRGVIQVREIQSKGRRTVVKTKVLWGEEYLEDQVGESNFAIGALSFFQVNREMAQVLLTQLQAVMTLVKVKRPRVLDLFCGNGFLGMALTKQAEEVVGIELEPSSVAEGRVNMARNGIKNYTLYEGDAGVVLEKILGIATSAEKGDFQPSTDEVYGERVVGFDVVIVDPPRAGIKNRTLKLLLALEAEYVVYISCNPPTLARDLVYLRANGYDLVSIQALDMFPQTYHLESLTVLRRKSEK